MGAAAESPLALRHAIANFGDRGRVLGLGALLLPALAIAGSPVHAKPLHLAVSTMLAIAVWFAASRFVRNSWLALVGVAMGAVSAWLLAQASYPVAAWLVAPTIGLAAAFVSGRPISTGGRALAVNSALVVASMALLVVARAGVGRDAAMIAGFVLLSISGAARLPTVVRSRSRVRRSTIALALGGPLLALLTAGYIGARFRVDHDISL